MESSSAVRALAPDLFAAIAGASTRAPVEISDAHPSSIFAHRRMEAQAFGSAVAVSAAMNEVFSLLRRLAPSPVTFTFTGETGTGKDVFAHAVHDASPRARGPFVVFDCGAVPPNLVESELFGHERGAFTGAHAEHAGAFERAQGGTLFLDEIGELPLDLQPRLLRALENRSVRRVGGSARSSGRRAHHRGHEPRPGGAGRGEAVPPGSLLPAGGRGRARCRRCASGWRTCRCWCGSCWRISGARDVRLTPQTLERCCAHAGRATSASSRTCSPARWRSSTAACWSRATCASRRRRRRRRRWSALPLGGQSLANVEQVTIVQTLALTRGNKVAGRAPAGHLAVDAVRKAEALRRLTLTGPRRWHPPRRTRP